MWKDPEEYAAAVARSAARHSTATTPCPRCGTMTRCYDTDGEAFRCVCGTTWSNDSAHLTAPTGSPDRGGSP